MKKSTLVILGTVVGVGVATTAVVRSKKGKEMKKYLLKKVDQLQEELAAIEMSTVKQPLMTKLEEITEAIDHIDWETSKREINHTYFELRQKLKLLKEHLEAALTNEAPKVGEVAKIEMVIETETE